MRTLVFSGLIMALAASTLSAGFLGPDATGFAILAGTTITNTGNSVITGDIGVSPGAAITGFNPAGTVVGNIHDNDTAASKGKTALAITYNSLAGLPSNTNLSNTDLGGLTLTAGVYTFNAAASLTGNLTLTGAGNFIFQIGTGFNIANNSSVFTSAGADANNIYYQIGSSATAGTGDALQGNFIALQSISLQTGTSLQGRALAINGAVTLQNNAITETNPQTPEPATFALLGTGLAIIVLSRRCLGYNIDERRSPIQN